MRYRVVHNTACAAPVGAWRPRVCMCMCVCVCVPAGDVVACGVHIRAWVHGDGVAAVVVVVALHRAAVRCDRGGGRARLVFGC